MESKSIWLDCDPGHDDAIAILLAFFGKGINEKDEIKTLNVLGISTTHGNSTGLNTYLNAIKLVSSFGILPDRCNIWRGSDQPLVRQGRIDVGIHGEDGLGGVECLPDLNDERVQKHLRSARERSRSQSEGQQEEDDNPMEIPNADPHSLIHHQINLLRERKRLKLSPISLVATGPLTNIALLIKLCPEELLDQIEQIVLMGGSAGISGNRSPMAEWNIFVDPESASIVFDSKIKVIMAGLNVTHQAIFTKELYDRMMISKPLTKIRKLISSTMTFFTNSYAKEFDFIYGPPIHDMLTIAYILNPSLFFSIEPRNNSSILQSDEMEKRKKVPCKRFRVEIDKTFSPFTAGTTIVDFYNQIPIEHDGWHKGGKNAIVLEFVNTDKLWNLFFDALDHAEEVLDKK